tara:strand:- start:742 stop:849 length:108 start_codon:yes stop_codon:yes gene_type:complete
VKVKAGTENQKGVNPRPVILKIDLYVSYHQRLILG